MDSERLSLTGESRNQVNSALASEIAKKASSALSSERIPEKSTDFEPFVPKEEPTLPKKYRFICNYGGPYTMQMELNRTAVERFIHLSHLGGTITLSSLPYSRTRGNMEVNPDFSVTGKRKLTWNERKIDEKENPYYRVVATTDGWSVQINGSRILEETNEKQKGNSPKEESFVQLFNTCLRLVLTECLIREKLSDEKNILFRNKLFTTLFQPAFQIFLSAAFHHHSLPEFIYDLTLKMCIFVPVCYGAVHVIGIKLGSLDANPREGLKIFLPPIRIEDVIIGKGYLEFKGRTLVRSQKALSKRQN